MNRTNIYVLLIILGCGADAASETEEAGDDPLAMPEWEDGAPGATCPDEYDPDRVYVLMQRTRFQGVLQWLIRDVDAEDVECSYKFNGYDFLDILVHPGRRTPVLSLEGRGNVEMELLLPQPDPVAKGEDVENWIWNFVLTSPFNDTTLFETEESTCGDTLRRWWSDATVTFYCWDGWYDEAGMPRFDVFELNSREGIFTLAGPRLLSGSGIWDTVAAEQQGPDYVPTVLDFGPGSSKQVLHARTLSSGTRDAILVQSTIPCAECATGEDLVLNRYLVAGDVIDEERGYIWPREIELEIGQVVLDGEGRWVAHVQEPAPDGRMFDKVIRGEPDGSETVLLDAPLLAEDATDDPSAIRIARVFTGA